MSGSPAKEYEVSGEKWNVERIHREVYDARTKLFVIVKVLETGSLDLKNNPEWALVIQPILKEIEDNVAKLRSFMTEGLPEEQQEE